MKISVIIPNFNDRRILRTINSIENQSYTNYEIIVVDGGSNDPFLLNYYKGFTHNVFIEKDKGIFDAFNKGIIRASGDLIYFIGSDDFLSSNKVFGLVVNKIKSKNDGVCIGCEFFNEKGMIIRKWYPKSVSSRKILYGLMPPHLGLFLRKKLYDEVGLFEILQDKSKASDTKWLIDLAIIKPELSIPVINDVCIYMQYGGESTRSLKGIIDQFLVVHNYAVKQKIPYRYTLSLIKTLSKLFQITLNKKLIDYSNLDPKYFSN